MNEILAPAQDEKPEDFASPREAEPHADFIPSGYARRPSPWARLGAAVWKLFNIPFGSIIRTVAFVLFLLLAFGIVRETTRNVAVIQPIAVPQVVVAQGFTADVIAQRLLYQIQRISVRNRIVGINGRPYLKKPLVFSSESAQMDLRLPGVDLSLRSTLGYLREMLGFGETKISGEIIQQGGGFSLLLRVQARNLESFSVSISSLDIQAAGGDSSLDAVLRQGALEIVKALDPYSLAIYYLDTDASKAPEVVEYCAVHDASCRPWAAFLRALAYQSDPATSSKAIDEFQAGAQTLKATRNGWPARGIAYENLARLQKSASAGDIAKLRESNLNYQKAMDLFEHHGKTADDSDDFSGDAFDAFYVGRFLEFGFPGSPLDAPSCHAAEAWYLRAAREGEPHAQNSIGDLYSGLEAKSCGDRPSPDYHKALAFYRQAGVQGITYAQRHLGQMYEQGLGIDGPSPEIAVYWYKEAAMRGDAIARVHLGEIYASGRGGGEADPLGAWAWFQLALQAQGPQGLKDQIVKEQAQLGLAPKDIQEAETRVRDWNLGLRADP